MFEFCSQETNSDIEALIAILSWGGMRRDHGRALMSNVKSVLSIVSNLRERRYNSRLEAFQAIQEIRSKGLLPGLGIGYFTKLICFLAPDLKGYIMDQWVGKSINLLSDNNMVSISSNSWVNDKNDCHTYESFCLEIEQVARELDCSGYEAERRLFSIGRGQGVWRNYLKSQYNN